MDQPGAGVVSWSRKPPKKASGSFMDHGFGRRKRDKACESAGY